MSPLFHLGLTSLGLDLVTTSNPVLLAQGNTNLLWFSHQPLEIILLSNTPQSTQCECSLLSPWLTEVYKTQVCTLLSGFFSQY